MKGSTLERSSISKNRTSPAHGLLSELQGGLHHRSLYFARGLPARFVAPTKCTNLADFLTRAPRAIALMQTAERLRLVVKDVFEQLQRDSVLYAEMRFAPPTRQHIYDRTHFCQRWRGQRCRRATRQFSPEAIRFRAGDDRRDVDLGAVLAALCIR